MSKWIEWKWTEDKTYPEDLETLIAVRFADGGEDRDPKTVDWWRGYGVGSNFYPSEDAAHITHYRVVSP